MARFKRTFSVGSTPFGVGFDGTNIWVANFGSNTVTKLRASDGAVQGTFNVGSAPSFGVAFDGANIWVGNYGAGTVTKLRASDGAVQGTLQRGIELRKELPLMESISGWQALPLTM